jgi:hypothetical protein
MKLEQDGDSTTNHPAPAIFAPAALFEFARAPRQIPRYAKYLFCNDKCLHMTMMLPPVAVGTGRPLVR